MSDERDGTPVAIKASVLQSLDLSNLTDEQYKARAIDVLERGAIGSRVSLAPAPGIYREWVNDNPASIARMRSLGFKFTSINDINDVALHSDSTDRVQIGDVVLMECSQRYKDLLEEARLERYNRDNNSKKGTKDEKEVISSIGSLREDLNPINLGSQQTVLVPVDQTPQK